MNTAPSMPSRVAACCRKKRKDRPHGFTLLELLMTIAIIGTLAALAMPRYLVYLEKARVARAITEIHMVEDSIDTYKLSDGVFPETLAQAGAGSPVDPWGIPYEYLKIACDGDDEKGVCKVNKGKARKDRFLVPINSDYDLYSKGKDGRSVSPLTAKHSRDDIIRANDGAFFGLASEF